MNDDFADFESELRKLQPAGISEPLQRRIAAALDAPERPANPKTWWQRLGFNRPSAACWWGLLSPGLTAAAIVVVAQIAGWHRSPARPGSGPAASLNPAAETGRAHSASRVVQNSPTEAVRATNVLYHTQDDGVVLDGAQEPVHRIRYRSADLLQWRNPDTGAQWEVLYPREDVALLPVRAN